MAHPIQPIRPEDIHPLTDFQRATKEHVRRLQETGRPELLTVNGRASVVVQDARAYQRLLDLAVQMESVLAVREGLDSKERGEGIPLEQFEREFRAKHDLPSRPGATGTEGR
jgi:hypothetical protein